MTDVERVELNELCSAAVDGALDERGRDRLQELLRASEEARQFYVRAMHLSASLQAYAAEMQSDPAEPANVVRLEPWQWRHWALAAAAVAAMLLVVWAMQPNVLEPEEDETDSVARLTGSKDCQWEGFSLHTGDELAAGQRVHLKSGVAELTFDSGALLMLHGPVQMDVRSAWEAELQRGTVKANVPQEAIGFRVVNSAVEVVDLGTEFSITANEDGATEVFVLQGAVEVHPRDAKGNRQGKSVLREKQARRFAKAGGGDVHNREQKFQQLMRKVAIDRIARPLNYARWSFDDEGSAQAEVQSPANGASALQLGSSARRAPGRFGSALEFDGTYFSRADLLPPMRRGVRTVACWVRMEPDALMDAGTFAVFPAVKAIGGVYELGCNRAPGDGVLGALRFRAPMARAVGSTSLRDGRWHHIAAVVAPHAKGGRPPLKLYVDGRLEPFSGTHPARRSFENGPQEWVLWIGGSPQNPERFRGWLDELVITEQPLTPQEIRHLMRANTLLSPAAIAGM